MRSRVCSDHPDTPISRHLAFPDRQPHGWTQRQPDWQGKQPQHCEPSSRVNTASHSVSPCSGPCIAWKMLWHPSDCVRQTCVTRRQTTFDYTGSPIIHGEPSGCITVNRPFNILLQAEKHKIIQCV